MNLFILVADHEVPCEPVDQEKMRRPLAGPQGIRTWKMETTMKSAMQHMKQPSPWRCAAIAAVAAVLIGISLVTLPVQAAEELDALVWCDHTDMAFIEPFERKRYHLNPGDFTIPSIAAATCRRPKRFSAFPTCNLMLSGVDHGGGIISGLKRRRDPIVENAQRSQEKKNEIKTSSQNQAPVR